MAGRIGISLNSAYAIADVREGARIMIERVRAAAAAGLDSLFVGDHHATPIPYYQNVPILGRMLAEWDERPCGALFLLPLWHPALLAEQVGTLASIASGPFVLQCAIGPNDAQFTAMGVDARHRTTGFEQTLDQLRRLWRGEQIESVAARPGERTFGPVRIAPVPPEPVAVWIGATAPKAIDRAARLGDGWIAAPSLVPKAAAEQLATYTERCDHHGRAVGTTVIRRDVYVAADADDARRTREAVEQRGHRGFDPEAIVIGEAAHVAASLSSLLALGYDEVLVRSLEPDAPRALASIERLAEVRSIVRG